jgi:signal transduction histidine kinase
MLSVGVFLFLLNTGLGVFTISKQKTFESILFGIFAIGVGLWTLGIYATLATSLLFWGRTSFLGAIIGIGALFLFSLVFPTNKPLSKVLVILLSIPTFILSIYTYSEFLIKTAYVVDNSIQGTFGPLMMLYQVYSPVYILGSIFIIAKKYKNASYEDKNKIGYVLLGITFSMGVAVVTNAILPLWFKLYTLNSVGPFFSIFMVGAISYAIVRHQFLDIKVIIQRGLIYSILLSCVTGIYLLLVFTSEYIFKESGSVNILFSALVTTLIGIFGVPPLKLYFQKVTNPIFFKHKYNYAHVLGLLTDALNETILLETMVKRSTTILQQHLKLHYVSFVFGKGSTNEEQNLQRFPIISNRKHIGHLLVGEKLSGDPYTEEDKKLLETFSKQAGTALEKASLYKQVKEYASTLEKKVEERTAEIVAIQKEQESLMLEISHGLQTPLTIMKGELFFLKKQGANAENLNTIDSSIDRISAFIYRLLNVSQLETTLGKERVTISLSTILDSLVGFFQEEAVRKGIRLESTIRENVFILGNEEEIRELFSNLISNAIKYMRHDGEKKISVTTTVQDTSILVSIIDTGIGIKTEDIHQLFKKFYRVKNDSTKGIQGTGLGLAICKKIAELHGGSITLESSFGKGTRRGVLLPYTSK